MQSSRSWSSRPRDGQGRPWVTLLTGRPGFAQSPDPGTLEVRAELPAGDGLHGALRSGAKVGALGIELATRRRNRVNGRLASAEDGALRVAVDQSFGNCPQHIRQRGWRFVRPDPHPAMHRETRLSPRAIEWIEGADTFFIGTGVGGRTEDARTGMDASHRGGAAGFVRVEDERSLVFPDYSGNNHFNTIGNLMLDDRAALTFVDFANGSLLQLSGRAAVDWEADAAAEFPDARRLVRFEIEEAIELERVLPLRWSDLETMRPLRVVEKHAESSQVTSLRLAPVDGEPLPRFAAGQHLPVVLRPSEGGELRRAYSLSCGPDRADYRISIKREPLGAVVATPPRQDRSG